MCSLKKCCCNRGVEFLALTACVTISAAGSVNAQEEDLRFTACVNNKVVISGSAIGNEPLTECDEESKTVKWSSVEPESPQGLKVQVRLEGTQGQQGESTVANDACKLYRLMRLL